MGSTFHLRGKFQSFLYRKSIKKSYFRSNLQSKCPNRHTWWGLKMHFLICMYICTDPSI